MTSFDDDPEPSLDTITLQEVIESFGQDKADRLLQYGSLRGEAGSEYWDMEEFERIFGLDECEFQEEDFVEE